MYQYCFRVLLQLYIVACCVRVVVFVAVLFALLHLHLFLCRLFLVLYKFINCYQNHSHSFTLFL